MKMPLEFSRQHRFPKLRKVMVDPSLVLHIRNSNKLVRNLSLFLGGKAEFYSTKCLDLEINSAMGKKGLIPDRKLAKCLHSGFELCYMECLKKIFGKHNPDHFVWATMADVCSFEKTSGIPVISATNEGHFFFCPPSQHQRAYAVNTHFAVMNRQRNEERKDLSNRLQNNRSQGKKGKKHGAR